jgi:hypothetical protein
VQRDLEDFLDFAGSREEIRPAVYDSDNRVECEPADEDVHRRQLAEHAHRGGVDADFFRGLAERSLHQGFAGISGAAGQADLSRMMGEAACPDGERDGGAGLVRVQQQQGRGDAGICRQPSGAPGLSQQIGCKTHLGLDTREGAGQPFAQCVLDLP